MSDDVQPRDYREGFWVLKERLGAIHYGATAYRIGTSERQALTLIAEISGDVLEAVETWLEPVRCDEHSFSRVGPCECGAEREAGS